MEFCETTNPAKQFRQQAQACLDSEDRLTDLVLDGSESPYSALELSPEAVVELSPEERFVYLAMQKEDLVRICGREFAAEELARTQIDIQSLKEHISTADDPWFSEARDIITSSDKPISAILASDFAYRFFALLEDVDEALGVAGFPESGIDMAINIYLAETGVLQRCVTTSDEVLRTETRLGFEERSKNREDVKIAIASLASRQAIRNLVESGILPADHDFIDVDILSTEPETEETVQPVLVLSHKSYFLEYPEVSSAVVTSTTEEYEVTNNKLIATTTNRVTSDGKTDKEIVSKDLDPEWASLLFAWLDCLKKVYEELETTNPEELRRIVRIRLNPDKWHEWLRNDGQMG